MCIYIINIIYIYIYIIHLYIYMCVCVCLATPTHHWGFAALRTSGVVYYGFHLCLCS